MLVFYKVPVPQSMDELTRVSGLTAKQIIATPRSAMSGGGHWVVQKAGILRLHDAWIEKWKVLHSVGSAHLPHLLRA